MTAYSPLGVYKTVLPLAAHAFNVTADDISRRTRKQPIADARNAAMWCMAQFGLSQPCIGRLVNRHHTTAFKAIRTISGLRDVDQLIRHKTDLILATAHSQLSASLGMSPKTKETK